MLCGGRGCRGRGSIPVTLGREDRGNTAHGRDERGGEVEKSWEESSKELRVHRRCGRRESVWTKAGSGRRGDWREDGRRKGPENGEWGDGKGRGSGEGERTEGEISVERTEAEPCRTDG